MTNFKTDHLPFFRSSFETDNLRPALLLAGAQVLVALVTAVLLTNGTLV